LTNFQSIDQYISFKNELHRRKGKGLVRRVYGGFTRQCLWRACPPFTSLWMVYQPMAGWRILSAYGGFNKKYNIIFKA